MLFTIIPLSKKRKCTRIDKMKEVNTKREHVLELERQLELYKNHYSHLDQIFNEITRHLLGPNFYTLACDSWTSLEETRDEILAKYKKVKK